MNVPTTSRIPRLLRRVTPALLAAGILCLGMNSSAWADRGHAHRVQIFHPQSHPYGKSYGEWAAAFWQWSLALPLDGHPFLDSPDDPYFDFSAGQSGRVWFWSAPDGPLTRIVTMPEKTALFLTIRDVETSSLEAVDSGFYGETEEEQRANSRFFADHIVDVFCIINGVAVPNLEAFRFSTPQFEFTAPTPWIFGDEGGAGTSVGDGYFLMLAPLPVGTHTIHYGGTFHFDAGELADVPLDFPHDVTIQVTVVKERPHGGKGGNHRDDNNHRDDKCEAEDGDGVGRGRDHRRR